MAFFPLHGWLPNAYSLAPTGAGLLFAPLMTKVTVYLMIRVLLNVFTLDYAFYSHPLVQSGVVWGAAIAIVCASSLALGQRDLRRMLTYLIVAEVGYMVGGFWLANAQGMTGAILHIFNDAVMTLCLFLAAAAIASRTGRLSFDNLKGLYRTMPVTMAAFTVGAFSLIGVPPTCGFFSKWYLLQGAVQAGQWGFMGALIVSSLINAVLFFRIIELAYFNNGGTRHDHDHDPQHHRSNLQEAPLAMLMPLVLSAAAILVIGLGSGTLVTIIKTVLPQFN
jgi:multicomponent Na+:H+ antiporter subunit D